MYKIYLENVQSPLVIEINQKPNIHEFVETTDLNKDIDSALNFIDTNGFVYCKDIFGDMSIIKCMSIIKIASVDSYEETIISSIRNEYQERKLKFDRLDSKNKSVSDYKIFCGNKKQLAQQLEEYIF